MPKFPSLEWAEQLREVLNESDAYRNASKGLTARFLFHVQAGGPLDEDHFLSVRLEDGECVAVEETSGTEGDGADFVLRGEYSDWVGLLRGEYDPVQAVLTRRLEVRGSIAKLMRHVAAAKELGRATRRVDTEFLS